MNVTVTELAGGSSISSTVFRVYSHSGY